MQRALNRMRSKTLQGCLHNWHRAFRISVQAASHIASPAIHLTGGGAITVQSLCNHCAITVQSLCTVNVVTVQEFIDMYVSSPQLRFKSTQASRERAVSLEAEGIIGVTSR